MTQEEKAKAYDEALKKAKAIVNSINVGLIGKDSFEAVFPELKESESKGENESKDEKIRKELISHFCGIRDNCGKDWYGYDINDVISWLEKQGESIKIKKGKNYLCTKTHKYAGVEWIEGIKYYSPENYSLVNQGCIYYCPKYIKKEHNNLFKEVEYDDNLEANKIKPKFKVGDWIITDKKHIWYVDEISKTTLYMYVLINRYGKIMVADFETVDKKARLWTIKDAEDGDILAAEPINDFPGSFIAIYKERGLDSFNSHCCVSYDGKFYKDIIRHDIHHIHPANKEQSDTLFAKMKEAGYKWDFNKKKLRKIEQNLTKWSERDIHIINNIYDFVAENTIDINKSGAANECLDWLKSLKPQWKPSEEQIKAFEHFVRSIGESGYVSPYDNDTKLIYSLLEQLKQL